MHWSSWRRELVIALGTAIVTSSVLVPIGLSNFNRERRQTEAARHEAEMAREEATLNAVRASEYEALIKAEQMENRKSLGNSSRELAESLTRFANSGLLDEEKRRDYLKQAEELLKD